MESSLSSAHGTVIEPRPGNVYLVEERRPRLSYDLFEQVISSGYAGLVITREFPKKVMGDRCLADCRMVWLTNMPGEGRINPTAIGILMGQIRSFIEKERRSAVLFDGFEYLASVNTYDRMLQFMHQVKDLVVTSDSLMFVPVDPRTLTPRELAMLERSMEPIIAPHEVEAQDEAILNPAEEGVLRLLGMGNR